MNAEAEFLQLLH